MRNIIIVAFSALAVGIAVGHWLLPAVSIVEKTGSAQKTEREVLYWVAPMDPNYRRDKPGKSPMGMDLVPFYADQGSSGADVLAIDPAIVNNLGVRTANVQQGDLHRNIDTVGFLSPDETKVAHVHVRVAGWVETLNRKAVGEEVEEGELLFELYAPELLSAQSELLQAMRIKNSALIKAAEDRLFVLGMNREQVNQVKSSGQIVERIGVRAPQKGVIMALNIGEGMHVQPGTTIFSLADLSSIWVKVEVFEAQAAWVQKGQSARMTLPFLPAEVWEGVVDHVYPTVDPKSRTVQVRLIFENDDRRLKPDMYGEVSLSAAPVIDTLSVPREAIIRTGKTDRVILAVDDGKFRPAEVLTGIESEGQVEIKAGLALGERVVTSGQFLIDSEASMNAALLRLLDNSPTEMKEEAETEAARHQVVGAINFINDDGTANLTHGPIDTLDMMGMTMNFKVMDGLDITQFGAGEQLHFEITQGTDGWLTIVSVRRM